MRILGLIGSNRKKGSSYLLLKEAFQRVSSTETKIVQIAELDVKTL